MALSRLDAARELDSMLRAALTAAEVSIVDDVAGVEFPITMALLQTGTAYSDLATATVADADVLGFLKVLLWEGLKQIERAVPHWVDVTLDGPSMSKSRSQFGTKLAVMIERAGNEAMPFITAGATGFSRGVITFDSIEPLPTWG